MVGVSRMSLVSDSEKEVQSIVFYFRWTEIDPARELRWCL
jgi:hypothetical protein